MKILPQRSFYRRMIKPLASLKLAVLTMALMAILSAVGTFVEAKLGLEHAQKLVYQSYWMVAVMVLFVTNLTAVILDRWPWQAKHSSFILAHIGLIMLVLGQWVGNNYGLDGTMSINIGSENKFVTVSKTEVQVYSSFDAVQYTRLYRQDVDFITRPPTPQKPLAYKLEDDELRFTDFKPFVVPKRDILPSEHANSGRAVRFQIKNQQTQAVEWLFQKSAQLSDIKPMGLMNVVLGPIKPELMGQNILHFEFQNNELVVTTYKKGKEQLDRRWLVKESESLQLDWMGFELKLLRVLPQAEESWDFQEKDGPTPLTVAAAKIIYKDKEQWVLQNDTLKIFSENAVYIVTYGQKRFELDFPVQLKEFEMVKYEGVSKAREYKSIVNVPGVENHTISMNEPLKYKGLTFYQASFQQDEMGKPVSSVLSVNYDPGRVLKYLGSFLVSLGVILLFYFRRKWSWSFLKTP